MCDLSGEVVRQLEAIGVRVRLVQQLGEGALYFRKRALVLLDSDLDQADCDAVLTELTEDYANDLAWAASLQELLTRPA